jgi:hypothetical protein
MITATVDHVQDPGSTGLPELTIKALRKFFLGARVSVTPGADIQIVQALGAPSGSLPPDPLQGKLADATGYPLSAFSVLRQANTPRVPLTSPLRAVNHG